MRLVLHISRAGGITCVSADGGTEPHRVGCLLSEHMRPTGDGSRDSLHRINRDHPEVLHRIPGRVGGPAALGLRNVIDTDAGEAAQAGAVCVIVACGIRIGMLGPLWSEHSTSDRVLITVVGSVLAAVGVANLLQSAVDRIVPLPRGVGGRLSKRAYTILTETGRDDVEIREAIRSSGSAPSPDKDGADGRCDAGGCAGCGCGCGGE